VDKSKMQYLIEKGKKNGNGKIK